MRRALRGWVFAVLVNGSVGLLAQTKPAKVAASGSSIQACGPIAGNVLRCPRFKFSYKVPFGWVDRTLDLQNADAQGGVESEKEKGDVAQNSPGSETLLAIFERPPGAPGEEINSAVVIAAEPIKNYPQIKQPSDYFGPITELAEQRGLKAENEAYAFSIGTKQLVRADFSKERGQLRMWQTSLVMIEKGYIVSFTFVAGSEDEAEELIANLSFPAKAQIKK